MHKLTIFENNNELQCRVGHYPELEGATVQVSEEVFNTIMNGPLKKAIKEMRKEKNKIGK